MQVDPEEINRRGNSHRGLASPPARCYESFWQPAKLGKPSDLYLRLQARIDAARHLSARAYEAMQEISATVPDWSRERVRKFFDPSRQLLRHLRGFQRAVESSRFPRTPRVLWHLALFRMWSIVTGAEIDVSTRIGGGLLMPHPNGIVIHPEAIVGPNCLIFQQVTLGAGGPIAGCPKLGGHVDVGAGAKILGGVTIGDHARIGANAVVLTDVASRATAVGVPARVVFQNSPPASDAPIGMN
jgi:serine O-acetyltransferase